MNRLSRACAGRAHMMRIKRTSRWGLAPRSPHACYMVSLFISIIVIALVAGFSGLDRAADSERAAKKNRGEHIWTVVVVLIVLDALGFFGFSSASSIQ